MFCPQCGKEITGNGKFCPYCGVSLMHHKEEPALSASREHGIPMIKKIFIIFIVFFLFLFSAHFLANLSYKKRKDFSKITSHYKNHEVTERKPAEFKESEDNDITSAEHVEIEKEFIPAEVLADGEYKINPTNDPDNILETFQVRNNKGDTQEVYTFTYNVDDIVRDELGIIHFRRVTVSLLDDNNRVLASGTIYQDCSKQGSTELFRYINDHFAIVVEDENTPIEDCVNKTFFEVEIDVKAMQASNKKEFYKNEIEIIKTGD